MNIDVLDLKYFDDIWIMKVRITNNRWGFVPSKIYPKVQEGEFIRIDGNWYLGHKVQTDLIMDDAGTIELESAFLAYQYVIAGAVK